MQPGPRICCPWLAADGAQMVVFPSCLYQFSLIFILTSPGNETVLLEEVGRGRSWVM